jgi:isoleucyl-tRNA synthetase
VHTAPAHGVDDFNTGVRYGIPIHSDVDDAGILHNGLPEYEGLQIFKANQPIIELLKNRGVLLGYEKIEHSYPHCWRCHNPVIFRATEQWFIEMDDSLAKGSTLRDRSLREIEKVKWDPAWGKERIHNMVATRPDWCISRQRIWGVPIGVFQCDGCKEFLNDKAVNHIVVELVRREGSNAWYKLAAEEILPAGTKCPKCGSGEFRKEMDILDVWFESGCSQAILDHEPGLHWPADYYLEGGDQHRGWFQSSLLCAVGTKGAAPYRGCGTAGWVLDDKGRAQSKSLGNTVDPVDIANKMGAEIVRLWVGSVDFREDVMASDELMQRIADSYRKIRNTFRYILGNLEAFDPQRDSVDFGEMNPLDQFFLLRAAELTADVRGHYDTYTFQRVYQRLKDFCIVDLSAIYFDILKDRLYTAAPKSVARRSAQTALYRLGDALVRLLAPITTFTSEEVWSFFPQEEGRQPSVHLTEFPGPRDLTGEVPSGFDAAKLEADWDVLLNVRGDALKALESARNEKLIGGGLEAQLHITAPESLYPVLDRYRGDLRYIFIVSDVVLGKAPAVNGDAPLKITVAKAPGEKCERCWNYSTHVGEDKEYPTVCERCSAVLRDLG